MTKTNRINWWYLIIFLLLTTALACINNKVVKANTIAEYEAQIAKNDDLINQAENIKEQLHTLAESLRMNNAINNGMDIVLGEKWKECNAYQMTIVEENKILTEKIEKLKQAKKTFVGNFKITHYCPCSTCNGSFGGTTAIGTKVTPYKTIAVDPKVIPLGSTVEIDGKLYVAEDTGVAIKGNKIDVCVSSHKEAYALGVKKNVPVYIIREG